jgi:cyclophilin family peptidyl-prolyl cis-trans isomerase
MKKIFFVIPFVVFFLVGCGKEMPAVDQYNSSPEVPRTQPKIIEFPYSGDTQVSTSTLNSTSTTSTTMNTEAKKPITYIATLHTSEGDIEITLNDDQTPKTVENFVTLAKKNFYDNTIFHRAIKGFMIQGGDPEGTGRGGPGYRFDDEPFTGEYTRGTVAMANAGRNTNGSQFFIMHADFDLPHNYVIFGHVSKGMETVDKIATAPVGVTERGEKSKPVNPVKVKSVTIVEK